jgi:hypothetical protein
MDKTRALQWAEVAQNVRLGHLAGEILERPERLAILRLGEETEDVAFEFAGSLQWVTDRLHIGHGRSTSRARASRATLGAVDRCGHSQRRGFRLWPAAARREVR